MATNTEQVLLRVGLDSSALSGGLLRAKHTITEGFKDLGKDILAGFTFGAIVSKLEGVFEQVERINSAASKTGIDVESFQKLSAVAAQDLPQGAERFETAMTKLNVKIGEGGKELEKWGIHSKNAEEAMYEIADKMKETSDPAQRAAMAVDLMGKSGADMVPLLERGAKALKEMAAAKPAWDREELENIEKAHQAIEESEHRITITIGKSLAAFSQFFSDLGALSAGDLTNEGNSAEQIKKSREEFQRFIETATQSQIEVGDAVRVALELTNQEKEVTSLAEKKLARMQSISTKLKDAERERLNAKREMNDLDQAGNLSADQRAELTLKIARAEERIFQLNKEQTELLQKRGNLMQRVADLDVEKPTVEDLAGTDFVRQLEKKYGRGGIYDMENGENPFAEDAQNALLWKKREEWDIRHGNAVWKKNADTGEMMLVGGQAYQDKTERERYENLLAPAGLETPEMKLEKMHKELQAVNKQLGDLTVKIKDDK